MITTSSKESKEIYGEFLQNLQSAANNEYLVVGFSSSSAPFQKRWRNNSLSANFLSDYLSNFLSLGSSNNNSTKDEELKSAVNYIANELLENAMKYGSTSSGSTTIQLLFSEKKIVFITSNKIEKGDVDRFKEYILLLLESDPQELYLQQLEKSHENGAGLGLVSLLNDYPIRIGWKFEQENENSQYEQTILTTMVQLEI
jgi:hypothetical protein